MLTIFFHLFNHALLDENGSLVFSSFFAQKKKKKTGFLFLCVFYYGVIAV